MDERTNALINVGGSLWERDEHRRIYFNDLPALYGLDLDHYSTGNIAHATLDGERLSNTKARKLVSSLSIAKLYWDCVSERWGSRSLNDKQLDRLVARIEILISETTAQVAS